jgi:spore maturation protein CgeB
MPFGVECQRSAKSSTVRNIVAHDALLKHCGEGAQRLVPHFPAVRVVAVRPGPHFSVSDVHNGIVKGLRQNGVTVADVNLDDRLDFYEQSYIKTPAGEYVKAVSTENAVRMAAKGIETACYEVWPEVVILTSGFFVTPETLAVLRRRPHHVVLWCTESPYEDSRQLNFAPYVDTIILNDPTNIEQFRQVNARTFYLPHSFDPDIHHPGPSDQRSDFAWVGTGFPSRMDFFEQVEWKDLRVVLGGMWRGLDPDSPLRRYLLSDDLEECCDNATAADLYRGCTVSANLYRKESTDVDHSDGWAMGPREVELAATGTFFLREPRGEGDDLLNMLPTFREPGEFSELLHYYVAHAAKARDLGAQARAAVADRTFTKTTARLLDLIDSSAVSRRMAG